MRKVPILERRDSAFSDTAPVLEAIDLDCSAGRKTGFAQCPSENAQTSFSKRPSSEMVAIFNE